VLLRTLWNDETNICPTTRIIKTRRRSEKLKTMWLNRLMKLFMNSFRLSTVAFYSVWTWIENWSTYISRKKHQNKAAFMIILVKNKILFVFYHEKKS
jgi:hypothetical protein